MRQTAYLDRLAGHGLPLPRDFQAGGRPLLPVATARYEAELGPLTRRRAAIRMR